MTSDVVLTSALRQNLLSLQNTQSLIDNTQLRLATGRKVNSALDNPQNFFASQALNNRASDLGRLLDGLGQNIQVIKAADAGVTALTRLIEQADSIAQSARDALAGGQAEAKVVGDRDLRGINDLTSITGIEAGDTITFSITDENGEAIQLERFGQPAQDTVQVDIQADESIQELITKINNIQISNEGAVPVANGGQAFEASLDDAGRLQIRTLNGGNFRAQFAGDGGAGTESNSLAMAQALGFGNTVRPSGDQSAADRSVEFTAIADVALRSFELRVQDGGGNLTTASRSSLLSDLRNADDQLLFGNIDDADDQYLISINGGDTVAIDLYDGDNPVTLQAFIDGINNNATLNSQIFAEFNEETGQVSIRPIAEGVESIQIGVRDAVTANFGFGLTDNPDVGLTSAAGEDFLENVQIGRAASELARLEVEYESIRTQITQLVTNGDTGYRGTNLLNGDILTSFFNETRSSSLVTKGVVFTAEGLGLGEANFSRTSSVDGALAQVRGALEDVRAFGSTLANDLAVIQTRQDFTTNLINTLTEGSDLLVNADQNEEGAKLLALQTRQQLGVTSLALASQSQQSILRLF